MNVTYTNQINADDYNMLRESVRWSKCNPSKIDIAMKRADFLIVAVAEAKTIGMARVMQDGLQALVMDVIVHPECQGQGIGKHMMQQVMNYLYEASTDGSIKVTLISAPDRVSFYEQFGFIRRPTETRGPGMVMEIYKEEK